MTADLPQFFATAATLSPILLLTTVIGLRRSLIGTSYRWRTAVMVLAVVPGNLVIAWSVVSLAFGTGSGPLPVLIPLLIQIGLGLGVFQQALLRPDETDVG